MPTRPAVRLPSRPDPRDVVELKALRVQSPELATAVDFQLASFDLFRRAQTRVPLPPQLDGPRADAAIRSGQPILRFSDIPVNWNDFRWVLRETADLLARFELIEPATHAAIHTLMREAHTLEPRVESWFASAIARTPDESEFGEVFGRAIRPFLARCAEVWAPRLDVSSWLRGVCPLCAGDPELGLLRSDGGRRLVCVRCTTRWTQPPGAMSVLRRGPRRATHDAVDKRRHVRAGRLRHVPALPQVLR